MERSDTLLMDALLVEATAKGFLAMNAALASHDELEAMAGQDEGDSTPKPPPPPPTHTATERCQRTCGGCRG